WSWSRPSRTNWVRTRAASRLDRHLHHAVWPDRSVSRPGCQRPGGDGHGRHAEPGWLARTRAAVVRRRPGPVRDWHLRLHWYGSSVALSRPDWARTTRRRFEFRVDRVPGMEEREQLRGDGQRAAADRRSLAQPGYAHAR